MDHQKIAIIGLGRIGSAFLGNLLARSGRGVNVVGVAEASDTPGRQLAIDAGLTIATLDEIVALGSGVDILFDLTGLPEVRREIREKLMAQDNHHTVVASETIARLICSLTATDDLPEIAGRSIGY
ncbi:homoserine dehydrogenase [Duganella sp. FT50W]|uniref:Homoserine dehydrogenase n=1 Tax=Duganella lactea TaxID=2692173 RepID=A0A6L8MLN8_9BURK|nr:homoserine dehydrogenase [Duganella lactea]MYM33880.1 homoserine dehydrogenase [Duganella lactea]MYM84110.1 homoserine dehydrogenase [Duganella lactea]